MVLEVARLYIQAGTQSDFEQAVRDGAHLLTEVDGCHSVRLTRGVETPTAYTLLVEWRSVQVHEEDFRGDTERYAQWRGLISPYFAQPPAIEHFETVTL